jgi:hypothetical protein
MAAIVSECEKSGVSAYAFCRERGINVAAFYRWRKTLQDAQPKFIEVAVESEAKVTATSIPLLGVKLEGGAEIQIFDPALAQSLLSRIAGVGVEQ